jgi:hypothetical protein
LILKNKVIGLFGLFCKQNKVIEKNNHTKNDETGRGVRDSIIQERSEAY